MTTTPFLARLRDRAAVALARDQILAWGALAALVGISAGFVNVGFRYSLRAAHWFFWEFIGGALGVERHRELVPLIPLAGAMAIVGLARLFPGEIMGYGFPRFLEMVNLQGARLRKRWMVLKTLSASVTIGSGGSAGLEGPIAQAGGAVGYSFGGFLRLPASQLRVLIACGSAGAIAAVFNAPIAGVLFAEEIVLLGDFALRSLTPAVISAVMATLVTRAVFGDTRLFDLPAVPHPMLMEIPLFIALGIVLGILAVLYTLVFHHTRKGFARSRLPWYARPLIGALLVGLVGVILPEAMGEGYSTLNLALTAQLGIGLAAACAAAKILTVALTLGSGNSGGVFAPSLFIGGTAGSAFGQAARAIFPRWAPSPEIFALVGMGAFLGAATHAPLTGLFLVFELTDNYRVVLPAFLAGFVAVGIATNLLRSSIDTYELEDRGINLRAGFEESVMNRIPVREVMTTQVVSVREGMRISDMIRLIHDSDQTTLPVVNDRQELLGAVTLSDLTAVLPDRDLCDMLLVADLARLEIEAVDIEENMNDAIRKFALSALEALPVVQGNRVVGMVRRGDLVDLYHHRVLLEQVA